MQIIRNIGFKFFSALPIRESLLRPTKCDTSHRRVARGNSITCWKCSRSRSTPEEGAETCKAETGRKREIEHWKKQEKRNFPSSGSSSSSYSRYVTWKFRTIRLASAVPLTIATSVFSSEVECIFFFREWNHSGNGCQVRRRTVNKEKSVNGKEVSRRETVMGTMETRCGKIRISNPIFRGMFNRHPSAARLRGYHHRRPDLWAPFRRSVYRLRWSLPPLESFFAAEKMNNWRIH